MKINHYPGNSIINPLYSTDNQETIEDDKGVFRSRKNRHYGGQYGGQ